MLIALLYVRTCRYLLLKLLFNLWWYPMDNITWRLMHWLGDISRFLESKLGKNHWLVETIWVPQNCTRKMAIFLLKTEEWEPIETTPPVQETSIDRIMEYPRKPRYWGGIQSSALGRHVGQEFQGMSYSSSRRRKAGTLKRSASLSGGGGGLVTTRSDFSTPCSISRKRSCS